MVISDDPASGSSTKTTASVSLQPAENTEYVIRVSRYNNPNKNFGLGGSAYSKTVGQYGRYKLKVLLTDASMATGVVNPNGVALHNQDSSEESAELPAASVSSSSGGGGGCYLRAP